MFEQKNMKYPLNLKTLDQRSIDEWLNLFDTVITDCDGVLWHENDVIPHVPETISMLKSLGKNIYFATNNGTKTRQEICQKALKMNYLIDESYIIAPTYSIAEYLKDRICEDDQVYVIGSAALAEELNNLDIKNFGTGEDLVESKWCDQFESTKTATDCRNIAAVVVGFDEHFSFMKMLKACHFLSKNSNCYFLATNADAVHKYPKYCIPGTGAILTALQTCVGKEAFVMGKPNPFICEHFIKSGVIDPKRTLVIGDCAKIDVLFGKNCGFSTLLVGTGHFQWSRVQELVRKGEKDFIPDYYLDSLGDLLTFF